MKTVTVNAITKREKYKTVISSETNQIIADEPISDGGTDLGFSPVELLAGALASCTSITLRMYADRKEWNIDEIKVDVQFSRDTVSNTTSFQRVISYVGNLEKAQEERLIAIANACPVHKTLSGSISVETRLG
ncbi:MAG: OsmC family protein [Flavobacteriales bacterium]|nr:OsmC family protein [Flavobacteriales bacterium]